MIIWIGRTLKLALKNFWRNLWLSLITIFILILTLSSISIIASLNLIADQAIRAVKDKVDIDIFFDPQTAESNVLAAQVYLQELPDVAQVIYTSSNSALEQFKLEHVNDIQIQDSLNDLKNNPLPASLTIKANDLNKYDQIISEFEKSEYNKFATDKNFSDHKIVINKLSDITRRIYQFGIGVSLVFIFFSVIMVFNTIRIAIYTHKEELNIMRLVGATNFFIRTPFLMESILYALIASLITMAMFYPIIYLLSPYINHLFSGYDFDILKYFQKYLAQIFIMQMLISLTLAITSSMLAIGKYLKNKN